MVDVPASHVSFREDTPGKERFVVSNYLCRMLQQTSKRTKRESQDFGKLSLPQTWEQAKINLPETNSHRHRP